MSGGHPTAGRRWQASDPSLHLPSGQEREWEVEAEDFKIGDRNGPFAVKLAPAAREYRLDQELITNIWPMKREKSREVVFRYDVFLRLRLEGERGTRDVELNKGPLDDNCTVTRSRRCVAILSTLLKQFGMMGEDSELAIVYDGAALLFSSERLDDLLQPFDWTLQSAVDELPGYARRHIRNPAANSVSAEIKPCVDSSVLLGDMRRVLDEGLSGDRDVDLSLKQFLDLVTSEDAIRNDRFTVFKGGKFFRFYENQQEITDQRRGLKAVDIGQGFERVPGACKGVCFVKGQEVETYGDSRRAVPALVIDSTHGTFYKPWPLVNSLLEFFGCKKPSELLWTPEYIQKANLFIRDVRLECSYAEKKFDFIADSFSTTAKRTIEIIELSDQLEEQEESGQTIRIVDKFELDMGGKQLQLTHWPCVVRKRFFSNPNRIKSEYYPIELLQVAPYQRVPKEKDLVAPPTATEPNTRFREISTHLAAMNLHEGGKHNQVLRRFGYGVEESPLCVYPVRRVPPLVIYKNNHEVTIDAARASWNSGRASYFDGGEIGNLVVCGVGRSAREKECIELAYKAILNRARSRGLLIHNSKLELMDSLSVQELHDGMRGYYTTDEYKKGMQTLIFLITDLELHSELKLFERCFNLPTQHATLSKIMTSMRDNHVNSALINNYVAKLSVKAGGHNYVVQPDRRSSSKWLQNIMVIGYDVSHAPPSKGPKQAQLQQPSVVGFSFNGDSVPDRFIGDYHFTKTNKERVPDEVLIRRVAWMLDLWLRSHSDLPAKIVVLRDGVSDGQYKKTYGELQALKQGVLEFGRTRGIEGYCPPFLYMIGTKRHHRRFFEPLPNGQFGNPHPFSFVDAGAVRPDMTQFFAVSHRAIKGTVQAVMFTLVVNELNYDINMLQKMVLSLSFMHQVSENAISLPEPVRQADEWASRGSRNYRAYVRLASLFNWPAIPLDQNGDINKSELTSMLAYWNTPLEMLRVNA